jgi:hypothetical protein
MTMISESEMNMETNIYKRMVKESRDKLRKLTDSYPLLHDQLLLAEMNTDILTIKKLYSEIAYIYEEEKEKKTRNLIYVSPPSFDQAVTDFLNLYIPDMERLPEQDEFFGKILAPVVETETVIESSTDIPKKRSTKDKRGKKTLIEVDILIETEIPKRKMLQTIGATQTQKTIYTIGLAVKSMLKGITPIIITRDYTADVSKLEKDVYNFANKFDDYMTKHNVTDKRFEIKVVRIDKLAKNATYTFGTSLDIFICMGNETQIPKVINLVNENTTSVYIPKFDVMIDENDKVDYSLNTKTYTFLAELKEMSHQTFGITATAMDVIALQEDLKSKDVFILSDPDDYRGHLDILVKLLKVNPLVVGLNKTAKYTQILENDANLNPFLAEFSRSKPEYVWTMKEHIPNICLVKFSNINATQDALFRGVYEDYTSKFALLLIHEKGVKMVFDGMKDCIIVGKNVKPNTFVKDIDIPDWIQYLKDNGGVKKFPRIIVIAGYKAERCISFVSRDYGWHLTDMYYNPAKKTSIPTMWQETGRLTGRNKGKSHLHLHCTKKVAHALYNGFNFTNEAVARGVQNPLLIDEEEQTLFKTMKSVTMTNAKFPKNRPITCKASVKKRDFNLVKGYDGGIGLEKYGIPCDDVEEDINSIEQSDTPDKLKKVRDAYMKQNSKVQQIINKYIANNFRDLEREEFEVGNIANYDRWNLGRSNLYKILTKTPDGLYRLRQEIKDFLKL